MGKSAREVKLVPVETALAPPLDLDDLCDYVAEGGTLAAYAMDRNIPYRGIRSWLKENEYRMSKYDDACGLRDDRNVQLLSNMVFEIARFDPKQVFDENGTILPVDKWPQSARAALSQIEVLPGTNAVKVRFANRLDAVKLIGKELGMFTDRLKVEGKMTIADLVQAANEKRKSKSEDKG